MSDLEETAFLNALSDLATKPIPRTVNRSDITCLLSALRSGAEPDELLNFLPGARAENLLAAHQVLAARLAEAHSAWDELRRDPTTDTLNGVATGAETVLPVPIARLRSIATTLANEPRQKAKDILGRAITRHAAHVAEVGEAISNLERMLATHAAPDDAAVLIGAQLHNPTEPSLWAHTHFLAHRVGQLSAPRVADLLGERTTAGPKPHEWRVPKKKKA